MTHKNTTGSEDAEIQEATKLGSSIENMVGIITRLDDEIEAWKRISGVDSPDELLAMIDDLKEQAEGRDA